MVNEIRGYSVLPFGSRAWGGATEDSDWDYVMQARYIGSLTAALNDDSNVTDIVWNIYVENVLQNVASVKWKEDGEVFNLIFYADRHIPVIEGLNKFMGTFTKESLSSKFTRCILVEGYISRS